MWPQPSATETLENNETNDLCQEIYNNLQLFLENELQKQMTLPRNIFGCKLENSSYITEKAAIHGQITVVAGSLFCHPYPLP